MNSIQFLGEWFNCRTSVAALRDPAAIRALCFEHVMRRGMSITDDYFAATARNGVVGTLIAENLHLSVRTFPEQAAIDVDVYVDRSLASDIAATFHMLDGLRDDFRPTRTVLHRVQHGIEHHPRGRVPVSPTQTFAAAI